MELSPPLSLLLPPSTLPGRLTKTLEVPPNRLGVVARPKQPAQTFPPGKHKILGPLQLLLGQGKGLLVGYVPAEPFTAWMRAPYLLAGDGDFVDMNLLLALEVRDPMRFLTEYVVPHVELPGGALLLDGDAHRADLNAAIQHYAAEDLVHGRLSVQIAGELEPQFHALLSNQGLALKNVEYLTFLPAGTREKLAQKARQAKLDEKMAEIESQAQMQEFLDQLDPDGSLSAWVTVREKGGLTALKRRVTQLVDSLLRVEAEPPTGRRRWQLRTVLGQSDPAPAEKGKRLPRYWWLPRAVWMLFALFVGVSLMRGMVWITGKSWLELLEIELIVLGFVLGALLESIKALFEKYEENNLADWTGAGVTRLDDLVRKDRPAADRLVRQQVSRELEHVHETLTDTRSRIYRTGQEDFAVKIRKLESKVEASRDKTLKADFGQPPYVSPTLKISRRAWETLLDYDEDLLLHAAALTHAAASLQQKIQTFTPADLDAFEAKLDAFMAAFAARARTLQPPQS